MELVPAILVFFFENYLKLYTFAAVVSSVIKYYILDEQRHLIVLELVLTYAMLGISFGSLILSKIDCQRIASYFLVPVFLALIYLTSSKHIHLVNEASGSNYDSTSSSHDNSEVLYYFSLVESTEIALCYGLGLFATAQLATNLFSKRTP